MQQRLQNTLSRWAVCSESELISDLTEMSEPNPSQEKILISRQLFARIFDNEDGPRIETIHSFCQTILSRFPIEAGVPPGFDLITEFESSEILQRLLLDLFSSPASHIKQKLYFLAKFTDERTLCQYLIQVLQKRDIIEKFATVPSSAGRFNDGGSFRRFGSEGVGSWLVSIGSVVSVLSCLDCCCMSRSDCR